MPALQAGLRERGVLVQVLLNALQAVHGLVSKKQPGALLSAPVPELSPLHVESNASSGLLRTRTTRLGTCQGFLFMLRSVEQ